MKSMTGSQTRAGLLWLALLVTADAEDCVLSNDQQSLFF
jgi:hypothetical protein